MGALLRIAMTLEQCWHDVPGGTARAAIDSARSLQRRDDVDVVGVAARHGQPPPLPWTPPVHVAHLKLPRLAMYEAWHWVRRPRVESATGPVDVIHATGVAVPPRSAPLVVTINDLAFLHDSSHFTRRGVSFFRRATELARREADIVVCPSAATMQDCTDVGFDAGRLRLVPYGIDPPERMIDEESARVRYDIDGRYVLWVGTLEPRKNLPALLEAFQLLEAQDATLVLVGPAGWNDVASMVESGRSARVRWLGFVPDEDLASLYAGAAAFCYPSLREGFGLPVLEAMAHGLPVVTSTGTATEELVGGPEPSGLAVDPRSPKAIAEALDEILSSPARAAALGRAAAARASQFSWDASADQLLAAYRDAIAGSRG